MSISIYDGYQLEWMELQDLCEFIDKFRKDLRSLARETFYQKFFEKVVHTHDYYTLQPDKKTFSALFTVWNWKTKGQAAIREKRFTMSEWNFTCSVSIFPLFEEKVMLAQLFRQTLGRRNYESLWTDHKEVEPFFYGKSEDKPEEVSEKEWKKRKELWKKALNLEGTSSWKSSWKGFNFEICPMQPPGTYTMPVDQELLEKYQPTFEERLEHRAGILVSSDFHRGEKGWVGSIGAYRKWMESEEGLERKEEHRENLRSILKKDITIEDLNEEKT